MDSDWKAVAQATLQGAETGAVTFGEGVQALVSAGFDSYAVDLRRGTHTYYRPDGQTLELATPSATARAPVTEHFDAAVVRDAIREAQTLAAGYSYRGFCDKVAGAGCAGYLVSFPDRRVLYYGRDGATHTEHFPDARS